MGCEALPIEYYFSKSDSNESLFLLGSVCSENRLYRANSEVNKKRIYAVFQPAIFNYRYYNPAQGKWLSRDPIQEKGGLNLYGFINNNVVNGWDRLGLDGPGSFIPGGGGWGVGQGFPIEESDPIEKPGSGESMIPMYGAGINASYNFQEGNYGWGAFYTAMAISDVFLIKSMAQAFGKGCWKVGSHSWSATRRWYGKHWNLPKYTEVHHWLIRQGSWFGSKVPEVVKNQPWNLVPIYKTSEYSSRVLHMAVHGSKATVKLGYAKWFWYGTPQYVKAATLSATFRATTKFEKVGESDKFTLIDDTGEGQVKTYRYEESYGPLQFRQGVE